MTPAVVPEDDDRSAQVTQEVPEKLADLGLADIGPVHAVVEAEPVSTRTHRDAGNDREAVVALPEA